MPLQHSAFVEQVNPTQVGGVAQTPPEGSCPGGQTQSPPWQVPPLQLPHVPPQPSSPQFLPVQSGKQTQSPPWHSSFPVHASQLSPPAPQKPLLVPLRQVSPSQQPSQLLVVQRHCPLTHSCSAEHALTQLSFWQISQGPQSGLVQHALSGMQRPLQSRWPARH